MRERMLWVASLPLKVVVLAARAISSAGRCQAGL